jgi:biotin carboxyl carrier protein
MKWVVRGAGQDHEVEVRRCSETFEVTIGGVSREVELVRLGEAVASLRYVDDCRSFHVLFERPVDADHRRDLRVAVGERELPLEVLTPLEARVGDVAEARGGASRIDAPIPGKVLAVKVAVGDEVEPGQPVVVLEAMKMENELAAEHAGTVARIHVEPGATVRAGELLVELESP